MRVRKTIRRPGEPDDIKVYDVPLNNKTNGAMVSNKVIYDLKKKGRSTVETNTGATVTFELI